MSVKKGSIGKKKIDKNKAMRWFVYMFIYTIIVSIVSGTVTQNFKNLLIFGNIYMDWWIFFVSMTGLGWTIITYLIFEEKELDV